MRLQALTANSCLLVARERAIVLSSTADLASPGTPPQIPSQQPLHHATDLYCCPRSYRTHTSRHVRAADLCAAQAKPSSQPCPVLSPSVRPKRQESLGACSRTTGFQRAKAGGGDMCYRSHGLLPTRQRVLRAGDVAQLMRCRQSLLALQPGPPCPVARVPFWSSCARVRERDEIMSVPIRAQTLHESRSGRLAGH